ncbi:hypothetical protein LTR37_007914 [Vermiconidia calcicola]|uniref:Uncharacterized protein n=1 Tax=Vermiconidia calcicola TaxID=1690605 RepID=A0ACC3NE33_9PEZI|nr:hypothetical protein LTR37_007914 [Vermiconidia calcicola]
MLFSKLEGRQLNWGVSIACGAGFTLFGYDQGVFGGVLTNPAFIKTFDNPSAVVQSQLVSTYYLGAVFGAFASNYIGDKIGRRRAILLGCIFLTVGGALQAAAFGLPQMIVGRIVGGVGTGLNTTAIPLWQVEISRKANRGFLIAFELVLLGIAQVIAAFINFGFTYLPHTAVAWRFPLAMQSFFSILTFVCVLPMPESARWLLLKDRRAEANDVIARLLARPSDHPDVFQETQMLVNVIQNEQEIQSTSYKEVFRNGPTQTLRRIALGCGTAAMQQATGINVVTNYLPVILTAVLGLDEKLALALSACSSINLTIWGITSMWLIDHAGRRTLMLWCAAGQSVCFFVVAAGVRYQANERLGVMTVFFIFLFGTFFAEGYFAIPWLYPAEINSQRMRNRGASISTTTNWLCVYIVVLVTPIGIRDLGWGFFLIFGFLNAAFLPILWFFYVETKGLSLEQIDLLFEIKHKAGSKVSITQARNMALEQTAAFVALDEGKHGVEQLENIAGER